MKKFGIVASVLLLSVLALNWATGYAIAGYVIRHGVPVLGYAFWQFCGSFIALFIIQLIRNDINIKKFNLKYATGCALLGILLPNLITFYVARYIESGILTAIANLTPLIVYPITVLLGLERLRFIRLISILIGMIGLFSLINIKINLNYVTDIKLLQYFIIAITIPFFYASSMVFVAKFKPVEGNSLNYSFSMLLIASVLICPYVFLNHAYYPLQIMDIKSWLIIIEIILSTFGYLLMFFIINRIGPVIFALVSPLTMIFGLLYGCIIFKQQMSLSSYISISIILLAILSLIYTNKRK